jgi:tryptophan 7-halogenase
MMDSLIQRIVIVGGGTAGWLSACLLAAQRSDLSVTLVEAPNIPTIGVGEGTWPTMRETLAKIGVPEAEFLRECDASFKQGSRFDGWLDGSATDSYLHPFTPPPSDEMRDLLSAWKHSAPESPFAAAMTSQFAACANNLAPRQRTMPDYAGALNYGYHLDAGRFATLLARHATTRLGVTHISDEVTGIIPTDNGDIAELQLRNHPTVQGDLFIDCSGIAARNGLIVRTCHSMIARWRCKFRWQVMPRLPLRRSGLLIRLAGFGILHCPHGAESVAFMRLNI